MSDDRTLRLERVIKASVADVFDAWIDPNLLVQWWGPENFTIPSHQIDAREGGTWTTTMLSPEGTTHTVSGVYKVIDRPNRLVFTWQWTQDDGSKGHETEVTVTFAPAAEGTRLDFVQAVFENAEQAKNHAFGWESSFVCLERLFA